MNQASLRSLATTAETLALPVPVDLPSVAVFTNATGAAEATLRRDVFRTGRQLPDAVELVRLPRGAVLRGDRFLLTVGDCLVAEQNGYNTDPPMPPLPCRTDFGAPMVVIARFGEGTWGHWLCELLPKAVMVERRHPGRFLYAMPWRMVRRDPADYTATRVVEAFTAYGIHESRLVGLRPDTAYVCSELWGVTRVLSANVLHPAASDAMRAVRVHDQEWPERVALLRADNRRAIANWPEVSGVLTAAGITGVDIAQLRFTDQVALFRSARLLFSVLGSSLSGLVYAPAGVRVAAAVPERWFDGFFYRLVQMREGRFAEVRGPVADENALYRDSSFVVPVDDLRRAIAAVDAAVEAVPPP